MYANDIYIFYIFMRIIYIFSIFCIQLFVMLIEILKFNIKLHKYVYNTNYLSLFYLFIYFTFYIFN